MQLKNGQGPLHIFKRFKKLSKFIWKTDFVTLLERWVKS